MHYKLIDYRKQGFIVMGASEFKRWQDNLARRFDDSAEAGHVHLHVRLDGQDRAFASVDEYLAEFTVRDLSEEDAHALARIFPIDSDSHSAWYGQHDIFQPFAGK